MAQRAGITHGYVCQIERGKRIIGPSAAVDIWCAFKHDLERLGFNFEDLLAGMDTRLSPESQDSGVGEMPDTPEPAA
jgi:transcriptional regulator with XRE-family HTH domain